MASEQQDTRGERRLRFALGFALALAAASLGAAVVIRFQPEVVSRVLPSAAEWDETGRVVDSMPELPALPGSERGLIHQAFATASFTTLLSAQDTARRRSGRSRRAPPITDVVLLPCSVQNPRPDGSVMIPPHNPAHRTIVGIPSGPGEPKQGFVVPPHDPSEEMRIPIRIISMDSILKNSLRVPPHDPADTNVVRPDTLPCLQ